MVQYLKSLIFGHEQVVSTGPISVDWVVTDSEKETLDSEIVVSELAKQILTDAGDDIQKWQRTLTQFNKAVLELKPDQVEKFKKIFNLVCARLNNEVKSGKSLEWSRACTTGIKILGRIDPCFLSSEYVKLANFADLRQIAKNNLPQGFLLGSDAHNNLQVQTLSDQPAQKAVAEQLKIINAALEKDHVVKKLGALQLLEIKLTAMWLAASYVSCRESRLDLIQANYNKLFAISQQAGKLFEARASQEFEGLSLSLLQGFEDLSNHLQTRYTPNFWSDETIIQDLKSLKGHLPAILNFIKKPETLGISKDLKIIANDKLSKLKLYQSKTQENEYVLFLDFKDESFWDYYNCFQAGRGEQWGGLVHEPVVREANSKLENFKTLLEQNIIDPSAHVTIVGFGLAGAVAQLLAFNYEKEQESSDRKYTICSIGTPPCFDVNAANYLNDQAPNVKAVAFRFIGDRLTEKTAAGEYVANPYGDDNWDLGVYELVYKDLTVADMTNRGHDPLIYVDRTEEALDSALTSYDLNQDALQYVIMLNQWLQENGTE